MSRHRKRRYGMSKTDREYWAKTKSRAFFINRLVGVLVERDVRAKHLVRRKTFAKLLEELIYYDSKAYPNPPALQKSLDEVAMHWP